MDEFKVVLKHQSDFDAFTDAMDKILPDESCGDICQSCAFFISQEQVAPHMGKRGWSKGCGVSIISIVQQLVQGAHSRQVT